MPVEREGGGGGSPSHEQDPTRIPVPSAPHRCYAVLILHRHRECVAVELGFGLEFVDDAGLVRGKNVAQGGYGLSGAIRSERWEW